jgi:hypothetical protein
MAELGNTIVRGTLEVLEDIRLSDLNTAPTSSSDTGTKGEIRFTADFVYVCIALDTWVRSQLVSW